MSEGSTEGSPAPSKRGWLQTLAINVLRAGRIPRHVAFIMDGNRRYAQKVHVDKARGHALGFDKLEETLELCLDLGVQIVTVYAFSIENFKRSKDEVDALMMLAKDKFVKLAEHSDVIARHGVSIRVLGDVAMLPLDVQEAVARAVTMSKCNNRAVLNVCFPYTSRHEITLAARDIAKGVAAGAIECSDVDGALLSRCLYTADSPDPDLLVRTSGESRLSDFLLWQTTYSCVDFLDVLWPEFSLRHLFLSVLHYQRAAASIEAYRAKLSAPSVHDMATSDPPSDGRVDEFLQCLHSDRLAFFEKVAPPQPAR
eukprot:Opistho-2@49960